MTRFSTRFWEITLMTLSIGSASVFAQPSSPGVQAAQNLFAKGNTAYNLGRYAEAAELFAKAYEEWQQPEFLYNIAQSYRLGGNCKQALHFYKRFRALKEQDTTAPLSQRKKDDIEKFIAELNECIAKAERSAGAQPDGIVKPQAGAAAPGVSPPAAQGGAAQSTATGAPTPATGPASGGPIRTAAAEPRVEGEDEPDTAVTTTLPVAEPRLVVARLTAGVALVSSGDLEIPAQPVVRLGGGYPIHLAPLTVEIGAALSYTPLPYEVMGESKRGAMLGVRGSVVASYPVTPKLSLRGELGLGIISLSGLEAGNPISSDSRARSFTMPNVAIGVAADYALATNLSATVSPLNLTFSRGVDGMYASSMREIDIIVGIGYRQ
jgi:hypothetical protein